MTEKEKCSEPGCQMNGEITVIARDFVTKLGVRNVYCISHITEYESMAKPCTQCNAKATRIFDYQPVCETHWLNAFHDLKMRNKYGSGSGIERNGGIMAEQKAVPLDVVVSDKGKKAVRIGKAFVNMAEDAKVPLSLTISTEALSAAIKDGTVSETPYAGNPQYPDTVLDGKKTVRFAGFRFRKKV